MVLTCDDPLRATYKELRVSRLVLSKFTYGVGNIVFTPNASETQLRVLHPHPCQIIYDYNFSSHHFDNL